MTLASVLQSVISQRLIKKINGGRKAVAELLFTTQRIKQLIIEGRDAEISNAMEEGSIHGMQSFNQALFKLYKEETVSLDNVLAESSSPNNLLLMIQNSEKHDSSQTGFELKLETEALVNGKKPKAKLEPLKLNILR
jgi:Tfp pilus assembly ATPase PilU